MVICVTKIVKISLLSQKLEGKTRRHLYMSFIRLKDGKNRNICSEEELIYR